MRPPIVAGPILRKLNPENGSGGLCVARFGVCPPACVPRTASLAIRHASRRAGLVRRDVMCPPEVNRARNLSRTVAEGIHGIFIDTDGKSP